jgi:methionyl-tRNA formyltransferase
MGSDAIALPALEWLWGEGRAWAEIVAVYTQPDRPHGRGQHLAPNAVKSWAAARGIPVLQPNKLDRGALEAFAALRPDAALVMAYGHILRQEWIDTPRFSIWNLHASLLPQFRGASPIQGAIATGVRETGVCLMRMVRALDAGPVLDRAIVPVDELETGATLEAKLAACCVPLLRRSLGAMLDDDPAVSGQEHDRATYTRRLRKEDGGIDFHAPAHVLARRINALFPWPGAFFSWDGDNIRVGLASARREDGKPAPPGTVLPSSGDALCIAAGDGAVLQILRLQRPGGRMLPAADFLRGCRLPAGTVLSSAPMPELVSMQPFKG